MRFATAGWLIGALVTSTSFIVCDASATDCADFDDGPEWLGTLASATGTSVAVDGSVAFVSDYSADLVRVVDVSPAGAPVGITTIPVDSPGAIVARDGYVYVVSRSFTTSTIHAIDARTPGAPSVVGSSLIADDITRIALVDDFLIAMSIAGFHAVDVSDPADPGLLGFVDVDGDLFDVAAASSLLHFAAGPRAGDTENRLLVIDPHTIPPAEIGSRSTPGGSRPTSITVDGSVALLHEEAGTLSAMDVGNPASIELISSVAIPEDVWMIAADAGLAVVDATGKSYVFQTGGGILDEAARILGGAAGLAFVGGDLVRTLSVAGMEKVDLSDPTAAASRSVVRDLPGVATGLAVRDGLAYAISQPCYECTGGSRLSIASVSDPDLPSYVTAIVVPLWAVDLTLAGDHAYIASYVWNTHSAYGSGSVAIVDVSNPAAAAVEAEFELPSNVLARDVEILGDLLYVGADFPFGEPSVRVVDVSNPASPVELTIITTSGPEIQIYDDVLYVGSPATSIYDLTDPASPSLVGTHPWGAEGEVRGSTLFLHGDVLRALDITDVRAPISLGTLDVGEPGHVVLGETLAYWVTDLGTTAIDVSDPGAMAIVSGPLPERGHLATAGSTLVFYEEDRLAIYDEACDAIVSVDPALAVTPGRLRVTARPNPFQSTTRIGFTLDRHESVTMRVFSVAGRLVRTIDLGVLAPGAQEFPFDARDDDGQRLASGSWFVEVETSTTRERHRIVTTR